MDLFMGQKPAGLRISHQVCSSCGAGSLKALEARGPGHPMAGCQQGLPSGRLTVRSWQIGVGMGWKTGFH